MTKRTFVPFKERLAIEERLKKSAVTTLQPARPRPVTAQPPSLSHEVQRVQDKQNWGSRWGSPRTAPTPV